MAEIVMVVSNRYDPDPRVQKEAASLVTAGHRVRVYAFDRMAEREPARELIEGVELHRVRLGRYPYGELAATALGMARFRAHVRSALRDREVDVIHCHDQDTCSLGVAVRRDQQARGRRCRFVYDAHDLYWTFFLMAERRALWRRAAAAVVKQRDRRFAQQADLLLTVSEGVGPHPGTAELYRGWGLAPLVLLNVPRAVREIQPLPATFTVGYAGAVREPSMFRWLVAAMERLAPSERPAVCVAGAGTAQTEVAELLRAASARLQFPLELSGTFSMEQLPGLIAKSSVQLCVYPRGSGNIDRALPVKMFDAVARGRLVIGTANTLMADYIDRHRWGFTVAEGDVAALADALQRARATLDDPTRAAMTPPPTWEAQAQRLVDAYERLLR